MDEPPDPAEQPQPDDDLRAYLAALSNGPVSPRPPIVVTDLVMPPLTQLFNDAPASTQLPPVQSARGGSDTSGTWITVMICKDVGGAALVQVLTQPVPP